MVDVVFMVTSSNSVGFSGWTNIIAFVTSIVESLEIDSGRARVGLLTLVSIYANVMVWLSKGMQHEPPFKFKDVCLNYGPVREK